VGARREVDWLEKSSYVLACLGFCLYFHRRGPASRVEVVSSVVCRNWNAGTCLLPLLSFGYRAVFPGPSSPPFLFRRGKNDVRFKGRCRGGKQAGYGERAQSYYVMARMHVRKASKYPTRKIIRSWNRRLQKSDQYLSPDVSFTRFYLNDQTPAARLSFSSSRSTTGS
jgi:hypothetical protein